jgi:para-nitrobenzyl esterase
MKTKLILLILFLSTTMYAQLGTESPIVKISDGALEGLASSGISIFKGIPFAAPPIGDLRWKAPQAVVKWNNIRKADKFGPKPMQLPIFSDMVSRAEGTSEDCLYLNVWTPAKLATENLPVLVYFYGGGFIAGDGSELRYDGESMARKGIVVVTVNYRLGIFGFLAHPELSKEASYKGSGNYGLLDQAAALRWVQQNIAAFGGNPAKVTIAGESAGSISVSAQMASPLSKNIISGAIGESGGLFKPIREAIPLVEAEQAGLKFAKQIGAKSLKDLRSMPAQMLLELAMQRENDFQTIPTIDGYFFNKGIEEIYAAGEQANVPLLIGWNSEEGNGAAMLGAEGATPENYKNLLTKFYGANADSALKYYPGANEKEILQSVNDIASDNFIVFSSWKWFNFAVKTGANPVYRYLFCRPRPVSMADIIKGELNPKTSAGAVHSAEIEYALGNLPTNRVYNWQPDDYKVSAIMEDYFANFIKTGNPNGMALPTWPEVLNSNDINVMYIDAQTRAEKDKFNERYQWLNQLYNSK